MVGVEEAESEVAACSDVGAVCGCKGAKCAAPAAAVAGPLAAGGGLSGCGFVQTSLVVSCSLSILGKRRTWSESQVSCKTLMCTHSRGWQLGDADVTVSTNELEIP